MNRQIHCEGIMSSSMPGAVGAANVYNHFISTLYLSCTSQQDRNRERRNAHHTKHRLSLWERLFNSSASEM